MRRDPLPESIAPPNARGMQGMTPHRAAVGFVLAAMVLLSLAYWPTLRGMVEVWSRSETFTHGFVVPIISAWLAWRHREALAATEVRPSLATLAIVAAVGFGWLLGELAEVNALRQFAFVGLLVLAVPAIAGWPVTFRLAFPLAFLLFAVPFGEFMLPQLMDWTATFTVVALRSAGVPVYREGLNFVIPTGHWSVVEACSGVRYLIASVMVGTLFAYLSYRSLHRRIAFVALSIAVPLIANWLRAFMIVMLGHLSGNTIAVGIDHLIYGWVFFGVVMLLMFWVGSWWREDDVASNAVARPSSVTSGTTAGDAPGVRWLGVVTGLFLAVAVAPLVANRVIDARSVTAQPTLAELASIPGWSLATAPASGWQPRYLQPSALRLQTFVGGDRRVQLYVAYYRNQDAGSKLVSSENVLVPSNDRHWAVVSSSTVPMRTTGDSVEVRATTIAGRGGERLRVWHWFWVDGRWTASPARAKAMAAFARLIGRGDDSAAIVIATRQGVEPDAAREADAVLATFVDAAARPLAAALGSTRDQR